MKKLLKNMQLLLLLIVVLFLVPRIFAQISDGSVIKIEIRSTPVKKIQWDWQSTAGGIARDSTDYRYTGQLERVIIDPNVAVDADMGAATPSDNFDVVIYDEDGFDLLQGHGADIDNATTAYIAQDSLGIAHNTKLALSITNAGSLKGGTITVIIK